MKIFHLSNAHTPKTWLYSKINQLMERNETTLVSSKAKHRKVCERCLSITADEKCPKCGHDHLREFIFNVQAGRKNQVYKVDIA